MKNSIKNPSFDQILAFVTAVDEGSIAAAKEKLGCAHVSSITHKIRDLEKCYPEPGAGGQSTRLIEKGLRRVALTAAGTALLPHARQMLKALGSAKVAVRESELVIPEISIAVIPSYASRWVPACISEFQDKYEEKQFRIHVEEGTSDQIRSLVKAEKVDWGIIQEGMVSRDRNLEQKRIGQSPDEYVAVVGRDSDIGSSELLEARDFEGKKLIGFRGLVQQVVDDWFAVEGVTPNLVFSSGSLETVRGFVRAGLGTAVLPQSCLPHRRLEDIEYRRLKPAPRRDVCIISALERVDLSKISRVFYDFCCEQSQRDHPSIRSIEG